ncbi:MAG: YHS domain-containing protein [Candidatus Omnitrophota bacterium]|nr:YHS domain-containing protein [Candidatus Omnitrophota bacterium]
MFKRMLAILVAGAFIFSLAIPVFAQETGATKEVQKAVNVGNKICPVSDEKINEKTKVTYEYQGKIYNFCCPMCIDPFKKDPEKYIKKVEEELQTGSKQGSGQQEQTVQAIQGSETMPEGMPEGHHH